MPYYREKSDYFRKELLNTRMFESLKDELRIIQKERFCNISIREKIKQRAEDLWREDPTRSDLDNWLMAESQVKAEESYKNIEMRKKQELISRLLLKFYKK
tara:strand:- start:226 stop:528 length:303 start_codon:yes stop_codon:yes gene_type:complete